MKQPEGYEDDSGRVCELVKTLYGLKQSGQQTLISDHSGP
jgi:hypothetical protein